MEQPELDYGAISIDNSAFKGAGYRFSEGLLKEIHQFKNSPVQVIQTDIVHNEMIKHIGNEISNTRGEIFKTLRSATHQLKISEENIEQARELLSIDGDEATVAEERIITFYENIGGELIASSQYVDLELLMSLYFETEAPFETGKDKKNEFPDAIALLSLEGWAEQNCLNVIAVSQDKGWKNYAENSERITVVGSISEALQKFLPHNKVSSILSKIRDDSLLDESNHILEQIETAITDSLDGVDIWVDASSQFYFEFDDVHAIYNSHKLICDEKQQVKVHVIRIDEESIVLKIEALVVCDVYAHFDFSVRDSIDKDYVGMGSSSENDESEYKTDILVTLSGDFSKGIVGIDATEIEVLDVIDSAFFGEIEPDWRHEEEEL